MQTAIRQDPDGAAPGVLRAAPGNVLISGYSDQRIPPGRLVTYAGARDIGSVPQKVIVPTTSAHVNVRAVGIVVKDTSIEFSGVGYEPGTVFPILRRGYIWVVSEDEVTEPFTQAQVRYVTTADHTRHGVFRRAAVPNQTQTLVGGLFVTATSGPEGLAILELDGMRGVV